MVSALLLHISDAMGRWSGLTREKKEIDGEIEVIARKQMRLLRCHFYGIRPQMHEIKWKNVDFANSTRSQVKVFVCCCCVVFVVAVLSWPQYSGHIKMVSTIVVQKYKGVDEWLK